MSNKTLVRGISAAAILAILSGAAYGELADSLKATKSNSCDNGQSVSSILGGSSNIVGGFGSFVPVYNRGEANFAATLGANGDSWSDNALIATHNGDWSILVAAKLSNVEKGVIWSTGRVHAGTIHSGLVLVQKSATEVALMKWSTTAVEEIVSATVTEGKYHTILVTHKYTAAIEEPATAAQSTYTIYVDGKATEGTTSSGDAYTGLDDTGFQFGTVHGNPPTDLGLVKESGILMDEAGVWTSKCLTAEEAATVAGEYKYSDVVVRSVAINSADTTWAAVLEQLGEIGENDIIEITSNGKTLNFETSTTIANDVIFKSGRLRIGDPANITFTGSVKVMGGMELWIDAAGAAVGKDNAVAITEAGNAIDVYGDLRMVNYTGTETNATEDNKKWFSSDINLIGGTLSTSDGSFVFSGNVSVAEGLSGKILTNWRKGWIFKNLNVPATSTINLELAAQTEYSGTAFMSVTGGSCEGTINVNSQLNRPLKLASGGALTGKVINLLGSTKLDLTGETVGFEKIVVKGGTIAAPVEITGNGNNGTVEIAANAVVKDIHTGANKIYTYSGAGSTSSTLIVTGSQNWGIADNAKSALSNLKLSVQDASHHFFVERAIGADVALEVGEGATVKVANVHHSFKTISGTGSIVTSQWPGANPGIILNSASTFEGTITTPVKLADGSSLTLTNGGTISADPTTDVAKKRVNKVVTTEGEGEEAVTTTAYTLVDLVTLKIPVIEHTIAQYRYSAADEWTSVTTTEGEYNTVVVDKSVGFFFQYISEDETKWTVSGDQSGYKYSSGLAQDTTYDAPKTGITVTPVTPPSPTVPNALEGGSQEQQTAYATWATANGVSGSATAKLADAFAIGATGTDEESVLADAQDELVAILATLDLTKITTKAFSLEDYPNATFKFVEASLGEGVTTTANLFHLTVEFRPANSEE